MAPRSEDQSAAAAALRRAIASGVPPDGVAFFARWWQFETWLRQLAHLELRAAFGIGWDAHLESRSQTRAEQDRDNAYMRSPDSDDLLAYLDTSALFRLIGDARLWPYFSRSLLPRVRWDGLVDQLTALRNRNAHVRRPHPDDLARIEQALRDIEPGAGVALSAFAQQTRWWESKGDPVARAWVDAEHDDARRLIEHARRSYATDFALHSSRRPWAPEPSAAISGVAGYFWHAQWVFREGGFVPMRTFWDDDHLYEQTRRLIVEVVQPDAGMVSIAFAAVDDATAVADAIGNCFDCLLWARGRGRGAYEPDRWPEGADDLDPRIQVGTALALWGDAAKPGIFGV